MKRLVERSALVTGIAERAIGVVLWLMWVLALVEWWGMVWGIIGGIVLFPGLFVFPIIYWLVEGGWPVTYLILYGIGIVVFILTAMLNVASENLNMETG